MNLMKLVELFQRNPGDASRKADVADLAAATKRAVPERFANKIAGHPATALKKPAAAASLAAHRLTKRGRAPRIDTTRPSWIQPRA